VNCTEILKARVSSEIKLQARAIAGRNFLTEAAWLKRLVIREIRAVEAMGKTSADSDQPIGVHCRQRNSAPASTACRRPVFVRFHEEDRLLLEARAAARGMRPATYVSVLTRSHLRSLTPLPKEEFLALKRSIGELASIGRNINQIAKTANQGGQIPASVREEFRAMLKICVALRENTKTLLQANINSWKTGHVEADL
jgi:hypothetical protein